MYPTLLKVGPLLVRSYGLMLALSFLLGIYLAMGRAKRAGVEPKKVTDLSILVIIASIVGARLFYVLFHLPQFADHPLDIVNPFQSSGAIGIYGLTMYGGFILAIVVGTWYMKKSGLPLLKMMDIFAPSIALGIFITRIGCFLNGCCFGKPSDLPWAVAFPLESPAGLTFPSIRIHPTQLYSSLYGLGIFGLLLFLERAKRFDGFGFWAFITLYSAARFGVDFLRYYEDSMTLFEFGSGSLSVNQGISLPLFILGLFMIFKLSRVKE